MNGSLGLTVDGQTDFPSRDINESQIESTAYGVLSYLHTAGRFTGQVSLFARYSSLKFTPELISDILYNGISQAADKSDITGGLQAEGAYQLNDHNTLRAGAIVQIDRSISRTTSRLMLVDTDPARPTFGSQISDRPFTIVDNGAADAQTYSAYVQDEWRPLRNLTVNYGLRFDQFNGFRDENQFSPSVNLVWRPTPSTKFHAGYARFFSPPPFELIANETVAKFVAPTGNPLATSTAAPATTTDTTPFAERADYFDLGLAQKIVEFTAAYDQGPLSAYANFAYEKAQGRDWISSQFNFDPASLNYARTQDIYLDHDETFSASAGAVLSVAWLTVRFRPDSMAAACAPTCRWRRRSPSRTARS